MLARKTRIIWEEAALPLSVADTKSYAYDFVSEYDDAAYAVLEIPDKDIDQLMLEECLSGLECQAPEAQCHVVMVVFEHHYRGAVTPHFAALMLDKTAGTVLWANSNDASVSAGIDEAVRSVYGSMDWQRYLRQQGSDYTCGLWMLDNIRRWLAGRPLYRPETLSEKYAYIERVRQELAPE